MIQPVDTLLSQSWTFDVEAEPASWRLSIPAKAACYALLDADRQPLLIATTANLRAAMVSRLGERHADEHPTKRIDYRLVTKQIVYRQVASRFEADWVYLTNLQSQLPGEFRKVATAWAAYWVQINFNDAHPRFVVTAKPIGSPDHCIGPMRDSKSARRAVSILENLFDLCREHPLLVQAPHAQACSYKQMGRCPAPCDGSIPMEDYVLQLRRAMAFLIGDRSAWRAVTSQQMRDAAAAQHFEKAAHLKKQLDDAAALQGPAFASMKPLREFGFVSLQAGIGKGSVRPFLLRPGQIVGLPQIDKKQRDEMLPQLIESIERITSQPLTTLDQPHLSNLAARHWLNWENRQGAYLSVHADDLAEQVERYVQSR